MTTLTIYTLKALRKFYTNFFGINGGRFEYEEDPDKASQLIYEALIGDEPCMIARFGSTEMACLQNFLGVQSTEENWMHYIKGISQPWWWEQSIINQMQRWSGFFPPTIENIEHFCELMLQDIPQVDILGSWLAGEKYFEEELINTKKIRLMYLEPFWSTIPWVKALKDKTVLVVHPFSQTIEQQYKRRDLLFSNNLLPSFDLKTIKAVQSIAGEQTEFKNWFDALAYMKSEIDKVEYDICLIGCGAYGFPLAAHVKRMGKKGFHLGGALQLMFGIRGKRWEDPNYGVSAWGVPYGCYYSLMNEYWTRPGEIEKPKDVEKVEGACYW
jgi:hypothetical protein